MPRRDFDPYSSFNFLLEIGGVTSGGFYECSGLNIENTPIEYREGDDDMTPHKQPGLMKYGNITLKRGVTRNPDLFTWIKTVADGDIRRENVSIILQDELHQPVVRWNLRDAWACKLTGPDFKANAGEMAIETLEICHEGLVREVA